MNATSFGLLIAAAGVFAQNVTVLREFPVYSGPAAIALDSSGIYSLRRTGEPPNEVISLLKHDARGTELWARSFLASPSSYAGGVTTSPHGVYVVGTRLVSINSADWDIFVARYSTTGQLSWTRQIALPGRDHARGVAADGNAVYVVGQHDHEGIIRKFNADGTELWTVELLSPGGGYHAPLSVSVDATGLYVAGVFQPHQQTMVGFVRKYDFNGSQLWDRQIGTVLRGVAVGGDGIYTVGWSQDGGLNFLSKLRADGSEVWTRQLSRGLDQALLSDISLGGGSDGVYVVGGSYRAIEGNCSQGARDAVLLKLDHEGSPLWSRQFGTWENDHAWAVALDQAGVYIAGDRALMRMDRAPPANDSRPRITPGCVVNAASQLGGGLAPGQIVTIAGSRIGPAAMVAQPNTVGRLPTQLADTRILFNGIAAPLLHVSERQSTAVVPYEVAGLTSVDVQVEHLGVRSDVEQMRVIVARPGIFTTDGRQAAALNEDGTPNSAENPAAAGSVITLFATGEGLTSPRIPTGTIISDTVPRPVAELLVYIAASEDDWPSAGEVLSVGGVPGSVAGLLAIRVRVPPDVPPTLALPVMVGVRGPVIPIPAQSVTIAVR